MDNARNEGALLFAYRLTYRFTYRLCGGFLNIIYFGVYCVKYGCELFFLYQVYKSGFGVAPGFFGENPDSDADTLSGFNLF